MLDLLYLIFISPIEFCMRLVFEYGYELTHSYGLALIGVSLALNTAVLPIYNRAEGWQEEERELKKRMAPKEKMIRRCFKGQERFAMIATLYRQSGYSPFMTLRASIGILLQIPFFLAAYLLLSNMPALDGVSFGPIRNLGAPDGLLAIGDVRVNVLPILMTAINLTSAFFYTHSLSRRDKIQLYGMAALFLVLLYNSPAGLTFYWTLNNIYSLCKNIVQKDWMKRQGWQRAMEGLEDGWDRAIQGVCGLVVRAWLARVRVSRVIGCVGLAGFFMLMRWLWGQRKYSFAMSAMLFAVFALAWALGRWKKSLRRRDIPFPLALAALLGIVGAAFIVAKYGFYQGSPAKAATRLILLLAPVLALGFGKTFWTRLRGYVLAQKKELAALFLPAGSLILFLIFVYFPFAVFSSDPVVFGMTLETFVSGQLGIFLVAVLCLAVIGGLLGAGRWLFGSLLFMAALAVLAWGFVVAPDVGVMDSFILQKAEALGRWYNSDIDAAVMAVVVLLFFAALRFMKIRALGAVVSVAFAVLVLMTGAHFFAARDALAAFAKRDFDAVPGLALPSQIKDFFTFSRKGKNIVVVMLDMFTGGNMNQLLERYPELADELDGFTWYEDVVTAGSVSIMGKPGILGGEICHPLRLNEDKDTSLEEKISRAYGTFFRELQEQNFRISAFDQEFFHPDLLEKYVLADGKANFIQAPPKLMWPGALKFWKEKYHYKGEIDNRQDFRRFFRIIGLYNIAPLKYKGRLYDQGAWKKAISHESYDFMYSAEQLANIDIPLYASHVSDNDRNSFIYFVNLLTHTPWSLDENGMPSSKGGWYDTRKLENGGLSEEHLRSEYFALKKMIEWFEWMKKNDVYNNTQIVLVSDHGKGDSVGVVRVWNEIPPFSIHGLLLVKEYGARGPLRIDRDSQMANTDVRTMLRNSFLDEPARTFPWKDASRVRMHVAGSWTRSEHPDNEFSFWEVYKIQGPLYKKESWTKIK